MERKLYGRLLISLLLWGGTFRSAEAVHTKPGNAVLEARGLYPIIFGHSDKEKATLARRQLYVAMTRAQEELCIIAGGQSQTGSALSSEGMVESTGSYQGRAPQLVTT